MARDPGTRLRDIAECVGITERASHRIVCELESAGYLTRHKVGRRNFYELDPTMPLRHPLENEVDVGTLLAPLLGPPRREIKPHSRVGAAMPTNSCRGRARAFQATAFAHQAPLDACVFKESVTERVYYPSSPTHTSETSPRWMPTSPRRPHSRPHASAMRRIKH